MEHDEDSHELSYSFVVHEYYSEFILQLDIQTSLILSNFDQTIHFALYFSHSLQGSSVAIVRAVLLEAVDVEYNVKLDVDFDFDVDVDADFDIGFKF